MEKFVKGEIVCSKFDPRFIGVVSRLEYNNRGEIREDGRIVGCFINEQNILKFREGIFSSFQKTTKQQKDHFKKILLKHGYSYYRGKITKEL